MKKILEGIRILDMTNVLAGPFATLLLAGLGARVIKIEHPVATDSCRQNPPYLGQGGVTLGRTGPDDVSVSALNRLRGKYGVTLDLKQPGARDVFAELLRHADIVVDNFSAGTLDRLGIGYDFGRTVNPRAVYCSISGFGATGTTGSGKAMDSIIQALSGLMMTSGDPGEAPVRVGVPIADLLAPVFAVVGILAALHQRERSGMGQQVDVSMLGVLTSLVASEPFDLLEACGLAQRTGRMVPRLTPFGVYEYVVGPPAAVKESVAPQRPDLESSPRCTPIERQGDRSAGSAAVAVAGVAQRWRPSAPSPQVGGCGLRCPAPRIPSSVVEPLPRIAREDAPKRDSRRNEARSW